MRQEILDGITLLLTIVTFAIEFGLLLWVLGFI